MPIHDWTKVPSGLFHDFHQCWSVGIKHALNAGRLPKGLAAFVEQRSGPKLPDVLAIEEQGRLQRSGSGYAGGAITLEKPAVKIVRRSAKAIYATQANRIVVKHHLGRTVAVIEIVSPGNKDSKAALGDFLDKTIEFLKQGIHVLIVDLFPPTKRDPFGIHKLIWDEIHEEDFAFPPGKDRILVSYETGKERAAYVEPLGVGDALRDMPLFLAEGMHVPVPLEATYCAEWDASPESFREAVETGVMPESDVDED